MRLGPMDDDNFMSEWHLRAHDIAKSKILPMFVPGIVQQKIAKHPSTRLNLEDSRSEAPCEY